MKYKEKHMEKQGMGTYSREREAYLDQIDHQRRRRKHHALLLGIIALGVILFAAVCTISMKMEEIGGNSFQKAVCEKLYRAERQFSGD